MIADAVELNMTQRTTEDDESRTTLGPKTKVRVEMVIALAGALLWCGWASSELNTIKGSQLSYSASSAKTQSEIAVLSFRMEQLEKRGSEPMQNVQKILDEIRFTLQKSIDEVKYKLDAHMGVQPTKGSQ